ncbi:SH3 domain-containing protein [Desulfococcaceae bacterium HSG8]|nr:SH3 domain-containing protein [Desulfococcaceae bacterium HSG8]
MKMMRWHSFIILTIMLTAYANAAFAQRMTVDVSMANIRSGPGTHYKPLWKVEKYHPIQVVEKSGAWYRFRDYEGDEGWIFKDLVRSFSSVIVKKNKCNVRSGPSTDKNIVFTVEKGVPFKVIKRKNDWIYVRHADGDEGWIHKALVW